MKKFTFIMMLLAIFVGTSWGQTTQAIQLSTNVESPEHVYYMKNGNGRWMTQTTGPTVTWGNQAKFAFFAGTRTGDGTETAYKIYCVTAQKWLSFTKAASYANCRDFATLVDTQDAAESWAATTQDGKGNIGNVYQFAPYNTTGSASKYMNWNGGPDSNPNDNTDVAVGLWQDNATADNGSCWVVVDVNVADIVHDQKMVRIKQVSTAADPMYMTIVSPNGTNDDNGGIELATEIVTTDASCMNQIFYLKSQNADAICKIQTISREGYYLQTFSRWGYKASAVDAAGAAHTIEPADDSYLLHENLGYVGPNANQFTAGSKIYSNHDATKNSIKWIFEALSEEEVIAATNHVIAEIRAEYTEWVNEYVGDGFGQYYVPAENQDAFNTAKGALDNATTIADADAALTACKGQYSVHGLVVGEYYRIENTAMDNYYLGIDGYTLNMKHLQVTDETTGDNNPGLTWKYEQDGENFYLKNVYAGLYPQNIPGGEGATAKIGTGKDKKFTYALHAAPTGTDAAKWNIFFGGTQVNCEGSTNNIGNVNYWFGDNAHYYIYKVEAPEDDFEQLCANYYKANVKEDKELPAKIEVDETADVIIQPSEFGDPKMINAAIDNVNLAADDASQGRIWQMYEALALWSADKGVEAYVSNANDNGGLKYVPYFVPAAEYGTIILPVNWTKPEGWTINSCAATEGNILTLTENTSGVKNKPYIVRFAEAQQGKKYQFIGYANGAGTANVKEGLLTGVLEDGAKVPVGSYILSKYNDKLGFYKVAEGANYDAAKYKCYLTLGADELASRYSALFFEGDVETGIDSVLDSEAKPGNGAIYNMAGQRLSKLQKGLNIVNGKIIIK